MPTFALRRATPADAPALGRIFHVSRTVSLPFLPVIHPQEEMEEYFRTNVALDDVVAWVAEAHRAVVAFCVREERQVHHLYVLPELHGQGAGSALLDKAKEESPEGLRLYTHQANQRARAFYEARGFVNLEFNDAGGEEQLPDVLMEWRPGA